jgi:hypothetical protein
MSKLQLILAFHNHQPVGNFEHVMEESCRLAYLPFLETVQRHAGLKVVLHYSGHLLSWISERHPEAIRIIRSLVESERAEVLTGGFYEPILTVLPERDRALQIKKLSRYVKKTLGYAPRGMWVAERVWEPHMPEILADAGIEYVPIDDYHFTLTGMDEKDLTGYYLSEEKGKTVGVFPGSEKLRYYIPFRTVNDTISYFREVADRGGERLLTMADDGEKFGIWPKTHKHCYEDGWLESFFAALDENSDWIETTTFSSYYDRNRPAGMAYLPAASYREMGEWTLPAAAGLQYERVYEEVRRSAGEQANQLIRGGIWRSFLVKYPEANHIHKRMSLISGRVHAAVRRLKAGAAGSAKRGGQIDGLLDNLWKGQCNDAYWHGIFGGLYLPHLRSSLYRHLLRAEFQTSQVLKDGPVVEEGDFDCDGWGDIMVGTPKRSLVISERGGCITELSLAGPCVNILDTLTRRPEAYHAKISKATGQGDEATRTIHDQLSVREAGLADAIVYDGYRRTSLLDHFLPSHTKVEDMARQRQEELGDFIGNRYAMEYGRRGKDVIIALSRKGIAGSWAASVEKTIRLGWKGGLHVDYSIGGTFSGLFAVEANISLLGSPHAVIRVGEKEESIRSTAAHSGVRSFDLEDAYLGLRIGFRFSEEVGLWYFPVETVSLSEQGVERIYQGTAFFFVIDLDLRGSREMSFDLDFTEVQR